MLAVLLNIFGLICIIISLIFIGVISKKENDCYKEMLVLHKDIEDYFIAIEDIIKDFDELIENSLNKLEILESKDLEIPDKQKQKELLYLRDNNGATEAKNEIHDANMEILRLRESGLSDREIAQKLKKGIREVNTVVKIWSRNISENVRQ